MRCNHCHELLASNEKYCSNCGEYISAGSETSKPVTEDIREFHNAELTENRLSLGDGFAEWKPDQSSSAWDEWDVDLASRLSRLGAQLLDFTIAVGLMSSFSLTVDTKWERFDWVFVLLMGAVLLFNVVILIKDGQTIGKKAFKIQIADLGSSEVPSLWRIVFGRGTFHLFNTMSLLGMINLLCIFRKDKRCLHDMIASTWVIKVKNEAVS